MEGSAGGREGETEAVTEAQRHPGKIWPTLRKFTEGSIKSSLGGDDCYTLGRILWLEGWT